MNKILTIKKRVSFAAAHTIPGHPKCSHMHGHNFQVDFELSADESSVSDMLLDFGEFSKIADELDHSHLNTMFLRVPTAENLCRYFSKAVADILSDQKIDWLKLVIKVWETSDSCAILEISK